MAQIDFEALADFGRFCAEEAARRGSDSEPPRLPFSFANKILIDKTELARLRAQTGAGAAEKRDQPTSEAAGAVPPDTE